ncbi:uncharacterized protein LOC127249387 [Andrographis paniculata]|uniref:uncharacterized protein LOC127249387 n=1 Tax=Andrographis paniculata TaxID=175694 RepID=UPI0021E7C455|nr:uncharacterized protein LOC127249387 [Andrographis paniculata]
MVKTRSGSVAKDVKQKSVSKRKVGTTKKGKKLSERFSPVLETVHEHVMEKLDREVEIPATDVAHDKGTAVSTAEDHSLSEGLEGHVAKHAVVHEIDLNEVAPMETANEDEVAVEMAGTQEENTEENPVDVQEVETVTGGDAEDATITKEVPAVDEPGSEAVLEEVPDEDIEGVGTEVPQPVDMNFEATEVEQVIPENVIEEEEALPMEHPDIDEEEEDELDSLRLSSALDRLRKRKHGSSSRNAPAPVPAKKTFKRTKAKSRKSKGVSDPPTVREDKALNEAYYYASGRRYAQDILAGRTVISEAQFIRRAYTDVGFRAFLEEKQLLFWATGLERYCPRLVKEFYANLSGKVLDPNSLWYHKIYIRGKILELSPAVINELLQLPANDENKLPSELIDESTKEVARTISAGNASSFGRSGVTGTMLTMKYQCLFRLCGCNILPTANNTSISTDMGTLIFSIDKHFELINFGYLIIKKMIDFCSDSKVEWTRLPYPGLICLFLSSKGIHPEPDEEVFPIRSFIAQSNLKKLHNDFLLGAPLDADARIEKCRALLTEVMREQSALSAALIAQNRKVAQAMRLMPRKPGSVDDEDVDADDDGDGNGTEEADP